MLDQVKRVVQVCTAVIVIAVLTFGTAQALERDECGDDPGELDYCPPYTEVTCPQACWEIYKTNGACIGSPNCCVCQV